MIMNEEGKLLGLPVNEEATTVVANYIHKLTSTMFGHDDWVSGPAILIKKKRAQTLGITFLPWR